MIIGAVVVSGCFIYQGNKTKQELFSLNKKINETEKEIRNIYNRIRYLNRFAEAKGENLTDFYIDFLNRIEVVSRLTKIPSRVGIAGEKEAVDIESFFRVSEYEGVRVVDADVIFNVKNVSDFNVIVFLFSDLTGDLPVDVKSITYERDLLLFRMQLYGL